MQNSKVYLFGTCLIDTFYPESGLDTISLLKLCGEEVIFPQAQTCCGQPPYNSGELKPTLDVALHTIQVFSEEAIPLIVPSASCAGMIKYHYPKLFDPGTQEHSQALELSNRTFELFEYIEDRLPYDKQKNTAPEKVSLHRSCSALREMKVAGAWLSVLSQLEGVEVCLPEQEAECCGFGGTFAVKSPEISSAMTSDKCKHLLSEKPQSILSGDCGCLMNIDGHIRFVNDKTPCQHIARFVAQRFGINND